jgi:hypothetical protein
MEITIADQRILLFSPQYSQKEAQEKAWEKKLLAFDAFSKVAGLLSRPKDDDFELIYQEYRYEPFWHVIAKARYLYDRTTRYQISVSSSEVTSITFQDVEFPVSQNHIHMSVLEHCKQEEHDEVFVDGITGKVKSELEKYLSLSPKVISGELQKEVEAPVIFVPPQSRVSAIMRDALAKMIKGIQADKILEEHVEVPCVDLYYHPIFAFQYRWKSKNKEGIIEVDGLTQSVRAGNRTFTEYVGKVLNRDFLFDIGADAAGMLVPGGSIAVKVVKRYIDTKKK